MRIRKHAKISPLIYEASSLEEKGILIQTPHVINCQLNQSPWDVMIFPPPPFSSSSEEPEEVILPPQPPLPNLYQFDEEDDTYMADLTLPDSIAVDHNAPKKFELGDNKSLDKNNNGGNGNELVEQKKVGQCRKKGKEGNNFCQKNPQSSPVVVVKKSVSRRPVRPNKKQAVLSSSSSSHNNNNNPYEYYYYSGFGPRWGKKRGSVTAVISDSDHSAAAANKKTNVALADNSSSETTISINDLEMEEAAIKKEEEGVSMSKSVVHEMGFDYIEDDEDTDTEADEDDDDDDYDDDYIGFGKTEKKKTTKKVKNKTKKRARKPIKARSLKSLM